jgi:hypothetical protein
VDNEHWPLHCQVIVVHCDRRFLMHVDGFGRQLPMVCIWMMEALPMREHAIN